MSSKTPQGARPNHTIPVNQAADLASRCKRLAEKADELAGFCHDLRVDFPGVPDVSGLAADLASIAMRLDQHHLVARGLWDQAIQAEADKGGC